MYTEDCRSHSKSSLNREKFWPGLRRIQKAWLLALKSILWDYFNHSPSSLDLPNLRKLKTAAYSKSFTGCSQVSQYFRLFWYTTCARPWIRRISSITSASRITIDTIRFCDWQLTSDFQFSSVTWFQDFPNSLTSSVLFLFDQTIWYGP